ncbi:MAG: peptidase T [candidate division KSB1 bacterium]|nr:peptidase T [candidate division KSB1 bacterium]
MDIPAGRLLERFLRYVRIDTQSREGVSEYPSTEGQRQFLEQLAAELRELGLREVELDPHCYLTATLPGNVDVPVPTIGLIAHVDTSPEVSGAGVKPIVHANYAGQELQLPGDPTVKLSPETDPELAECIGHDLITSDGTTLLGADDKAGIAEILTAVEYLLAHPEIPHGTLRLAFTPDEEVGRGTDFFDVGRFGARYAYTVDGGSVGEVENETFCADSLTVRFHGVNVHPGYAKGKMVNAIKLAARMVDRLPKTRMSPETTEGREGYVHPHAVEGGVELAEVRFLIRDFEVEGLKQKERYLSRLAARVAQAYPGARVEVQVKESYRNMRYKLEEEPHVVQYALEAIRRAGLEPKLASIRGGTDGARLCYQGLLTPNLFTGGHNFHSRREWISVQHMVKAVETLVHLAQIWAERAVGAKP